MQQRQPVQPNTNRKQNEKRCTLNRKRCNSNHANPFYNHRQAPFPHFSTSLLKGQPTHVGSHCRISQNRAKAHIREASGFSTQQHLGGWQGIARRTQKAQWHSQAGRMRLMRGSCLSQAVQTACCPSQQQGAQHDGLEINQKL